MDRYGIRWRSRAALMLVIIMLLIALITLQHFFALFVCCRRVWAILGRCTVGHHQTCIAPALVFLYSWLNSLWGDLCGPILMISHETRSDHLIVSHRQNSAYSESAVFQRGHHRVFTCGSRFKRIAKLRWIDLRYFFIAWLSSVRPLECGNTLFRWAVLILS